MKSWEKKEKRKREKQKLKTETPLFSQQSNQAKMSTAFAFVFETIVSAAQKMTREELLTQIDDIEDELSYIAEILNMYEEGDDIFQQNAAHAKFLLAQKNVYCEVYNERLEEFKDEIENEMYEQISAQAVEW
jgi:hypothetical protein